MNKVYQIFLQRLKFDFKKLYESYKVITDWTVYLYVILPGIILAIAFYIEWWITPPTSIQLLNFNHLLVVTFSTFFLHEIKLFIYDPDQLFLIRNLKFLRRISLFGLIYSFTITFLLTTLFFIIILPILYSSFNFSFYSLLLFYIYFLSSTILFLSIKKQVQLNSAPSYFKYLFYGISLVIYLFLWSFFESSIFIASIITVVYLAISFIISKTILFSGNHFSKIVELDSIIRNKWNKIILWQGGQTKLYNPSSVNTRFFRSSKLLFKNHSTTNIITDAFIKSFFRDRSSLLIFVQLFTLIIFAIFLFSDYWTGLLIWGASIYIIPDVLRNSWLGFRNSSFVSMLPWDYHVLFNSLKKSTYILSTPFVLIIGGVFGYLNFNFIGMLCFPIISIILSFRVINYLIKRSFI